MIAHFISNIHFLQPRPALCMACVRLMHRSPQAGGWLRGNREGIETLIDSTKGMLELVNSVSTSPCTCKVRSITLLAKPAFL